MTSIPPVKQMSSNIPQPTSNIPTPIKSATNPDKIRPISKHSARPAGITPIQSPMKTSSTASSVNADVPQIEINSPSPNSPGMTSAAAKSKTDNRDHYESPSQRFGYDPYMKQSEEPPSHMKSSGGQRKATKASTTISPVKQREHSDSRRGTTTTPTATSMSATPMNGNPAMSKSKIASLRHTSTSSEEQHVVPPTPMKTVKLKEQQPPPPQQQQQPLSVFSAHVANKSNNPPRLFIALFDYDPNAMSPNKDNEEELPFKEGQLIRV